MKILLHIGQSKTGTSAIQAFLTLHQRKLRQAGVVYPGVRVGAAHLDLGSHNALADALSGLSRFPHFTAKQYFEQFFAQADRAGARCMILSAEHFFGGEPRIWNVPSEEIYINQYRSKLANLASHLRGHEVSIIVYLRPQVDWLASAISQTVRIQPLINHGRLYRSDCAFFAMVKPVLRYCRLLDAWNDILQPISLSAIPFVREQLIGKSSIADFLHRAGLERIPVPEWQLDLQVNASLTREYVELKKILNRWPKTRNQERVVIACLERLSRTSNRETFYGLDRFLIEEIEAFVADDNLALNRKYVVGDSKLVACSEQFRSVVATMPSRKELAQAKAAFLREYRSPRARLDAISFSLRAWLRKNAQPLHALVHQLKRGSRILRYGR